MVLIWQRQQSAAGRRSLGGDGGGHGRLAFMAAFRIFQLLRKAFYEATESQNTPTSPKPTEMRKTVRKNA